MLAEFDRIDGASEERNLGALSLGALADDIVRTHHVDLRAELPAISAKIDRVAAEHGGRDPRLADVRRVFRGHHTELDDHMRKEEQILFPLCHVLDRDGPTEFFCGSVRYPIAMMVEEHAEAGSALDHLKELTDAYPEPLDSCLTHRTLIGQLAHLEADLHRHIYKENEILFPKAIAREEAADGGVIRRDASRPLNTEAQPPSTRQSPDPLLRQKTALGRLRAPHPTLPR